MKKMFGLILGGTIVALGGLVAYNKFGKKPEELGEDDVYEAEDTPEFSIDETESED